MKEFFDAIQRGVPRTDLFLVANAAMRDELKLALVNEANARSISAFANSSRQNLIFGDNEDTALLRVAHDRIDKQMAGYRLTAVHGLHILDQFENAERIKSALVASIPL